MNFPCIKLYPRKAPQRSPASLQTSVSAHHNHAHSLSQPDLNAYYGGATHTSCTPPIQAEESHIISRTSSAERISHHRVQVNIDRTQSDSPLANNAKARHHVSSPVPVKLRSRSPATCLQAPIGTFEDGYSLSLQPATAAKGETGRGIFIRSGPPLPSPSSYSPTEFNTSEAASAHFVLRGTAAGTGRAGSHNLDTTHNFGECLLETTGATWQDSTVAMI